jgi:predicted small lipoprotein YifL
MKYTLLVAIIMAFALAACGKPTAPESPDVGTYGQTIKPDHNVPVEHQ